MREQIKKILCRHTEETGGKLFYADTMRKQIKIILCRHTEETGGKFFYADTLRKQMESHMPGVYRRNIRV